MKSLFILLAFSLFSCAGNGKVCVYIVNGDGWGQCTTFYTCDSATMITNKECIAYNNGRATHLFANSYISLNKN